MDVRRFPRFDEISIQHVPIGARFGEHRTVIRGGYSVNETRWTARSRCASLLGFEIHVGHAHWTDTDNPGGQIWSPPRLPPPMDPSRLGGVFAGHIQLSVVLALGWASPKKMGWPPFLLLRECQKNVQRCFWWEEFLRVAGRFQKRGAALDKIPANSRTTTTVSTGG